MGNETRAALCEGQQRQKKEWTNHAATVGEGVGRKDECMHASEYVNCTPGGTGHYYVQIWPCTRNAAHGTNAPMHATAKQLEQLFRLSQDLFIYSTKREFGHSLVKWSHLLKINIMS